MRLYNKFFLIAMVFMSSMIAASGPGDKYWVDLNGRPMKNPQYVHDSPYKVHKPSEIDRSRSDSSNRDYYNNNYTWRNQNIGR